MSNKWGLLHVYTGNGKGKTTASLGLIFRAAGHGLKAAMVQFMKGDDRYGEVHSAKYLPGFSLIQVGRSDFVDLKNPAPVDVQLARDGWEQAKTILHSGKFDLVVLDEINVALACGLLNISEVLTQLEQVSGNVEVVCTGRYAPKLLLEAADLVTEMQECKHPYQQGIEGRKGIDF